jgi:hypothetical protein
MGAYRVQGDGREAGEVRDGNFEDEDELELLEPVYFGRMMSFGSFDVCIAGVQP